MNKNEYDVFIAFYNSETTNSKEEARKLYKYLRRKNVRCYLYTESNDKDFKANFVRIMQSKLFLFVYTDGLEKYLLTNGEIDKTQNYHLYVEMDCFLALTQTRAYGQVPSDSAIVYFNSNDTDTVGSEIDLLYYKLSNLHPLFYGRDSTIMVRDEQDFEQVFNWYRQRRSEIEDDTISKEVLMVLNRRKSDLLKMQISGINFQTIFQDIKRMKCVGISNWTFTVSDGCVKLIEMLKNYAEVEMLFLDPDGKNIQVRSTEEQKEMQYHVREALNTIRTTIRIQIRDDLRTNLTLYTYDMLPRQNMIFIYTNTKGNYAFIQNYSHNRPGAQCPCIVLKQADYGIKDDSIFSYYEKIYEEIKSVAIPEYLFFATK